MPHNAQLIKHKPNYKLIYNGKNKKRNDMREQIIQIGDKLRDNKITDREAQTELCFLFGVTNSLSKLDYQKLVNDFLIQTEEEDKTKPKWQTKNNVPILLNSLNEFYRWLCKNYW